jgi:hypothetical protein
MHPQRFWHSQTMARMFIIEIVFILLAADKKAKHFTLLSFTELRQYV